MQFFTGISRYTQSKSFMLSLTQCVWEFQSNALWNTHNHILLPAAIVVRLTDKARQCYCSHEISHCCKLQLLKWELPSQTSRLRGYKSLLKYPFLKFFDGLDHYTNETHWLCSEMPEIPMTLEK